MRKRQLSNSPIPAQPRSSARHQHTKLSTTNTTANHLQKHHLHIVQWFIQQGTPTKTNISTWFTKLNAQNRKMLFKQAVANRDVAHESFIALACVLRNGQRSDNILHALDTGLLLEKISSYVEGIQSTRSLWYQIVQHGP